MSRWFQTYGFADVHDRLVIGAYPLDADDVAMLKRVGIERVLNLVQDEEYGPGDRQAVAAALAANGIEERRLQLVDYGGLPAAAIEEAVSEVIDALDAGQLTYLHCRAGWQRSAAVAAGVVAIRDGIEIEDALQRVREMKPTAEPLPHQREDLIAWWRARAPAGDGAS